MSTIYLHIGTPKTGTTSLQAFFRDNEQVLNKKGIAYPDLGFRFPGIGENRNAGFLTAPVFKEDDVRDTEQEKKNIEIGLEKLKALTSQYDKILLSDEHIWNEGTLDTKGWKELKEKFEKIGAELKIVVYFRRQDQVIQSYWAQQVKEGSPTPFTNYLKRKQYFKLDYAERLKEIAEGVGKENIIVRVYEDGQYEGEEKTIISDFLNIFGLRLQDGFATEEVIKNTSLQGIYLETKRLLNNNPDYQGKGNFSIQMIQRVQKKDLALERVNPKLLEKPVYMDGKQQREYLSTYDEGNASIAKEYLEREDGKLFYAPLLDDDVKVTKYEKNDVIMVCSRIILDLRRRKKPEPSFRKKVSNFVKRKLGRA